MKKEEKTIVICKLKQKFDMFLFIFYCGTQYMKPVLHPPPPTHRKLAIEWDNTPSFLNFYPGIETFGLYS
jgi:hypothetical protein